MEIEFDLKLDPARGRKLAPVMHALLQAITILPYGIEDARATAMLRATLQKRGRPIGAYDADRGLRTRARIGARDFQQT